MPPVAMCWRIWYLPIWVTGCLVPEDILPRPRPLKRSDPTEIITTLCPVGSQIKAAGGGVRTDSSPARQGPTRPSIFARGRSLSPGVPIQHPMEPVNECRVIFLKIAHRCAHAGVALAETEVIGRVVLRRLADGPVPTATVLEIDHVYAVIADDGPAGL